MPGPSAAEARGPWRLADLTWPQAELRARAGAVLAVPVGATEQHGPHLPLSVDTDVASALAEALARRRDDVLAAPALSYGSSGEHEHFAGTLSIGFDALRMLLIELIRSAARTFGRVLLVVGHGGNAAAVASAVELARAEGRDVRAWGPHFPGDAHAGYTETSLLLALAPNRVELAEARPGATQPIGSLLPDLRHDGVRAHSPTGVLGDPTGASAAAGAALLAAAADDLSRLIDAWGPGR